MDSLIEILTYIILPFAYIYKFLGLETVNWKIFIGASWAWLTIWAYLKGIKEELEDLNYQVSRLDRRYNSTIGFEAEFEELMKDTINS